MKFLIKKNTHHSNRILYKIFNAIQIRNTLSYLVLFDDSCVYQLTKEDQSDINKLFGFSHAIIIPISINPQLVV